MILGENSSRFFDTNTDLGVEPKDYSYCDSVSEAAMTAMYENEQNWNSFINAINVSELQYALENAGAEMQYEAVDIKKMASNAVAIVKEWLSKALGVIQTFAAKVANTFRSTEFKAFIALNKKNIAKNKNKSVKIVGYKFTDLSKALTNIKIDMENISTDIVYADKSFYRDDAKVINDNNNYSNANEIVEKALGAKGDVTITWKEAFDTIQTSQKLTKDINETSKAANGAANSAIKIINNYSGEDKKAADRKATGNYITAVKKLCTVNMYRVQASLKIMAIEFAQAKTVLKKASKGETAAKEEKAAKNENAIEFGGLEYKLV